MFELYVLVHAIGGCPPTARKTEAERRAVVYAWLPGALQPYGLKLVMPQFKAGYWQCCIDGCKNGRRKGVGSTADEAMDRLAVEIQEELCLKP